MTDEASRPSSGLRPIAPVLASLLTSFVAVALGDGSRDLLAGVVFGLAAVLAVGASIATGRVLAGSDRLAGFAACAALAAAAVYGAAEIAAVVPERRALALFVAPGCGLAAAWWWGHANFSDHLRWVPTLIGAGWNLLAAGAAGLFAWKAATTGADAWELGQEVRGGALPTSLYGLATVFGLTTVGLIVVGVLGSVRRARQA